MSANEIRGEQAILLDGITHVMRPSWAALQAIEDATGMSIVELGARAEMGRLRGLQIAVVVTECIKADLRHHGKSREADAWDVNVVAAKLMEADGGLVAAIKQLPPFLRDAVTGRYTAKGEAKAAVGDPAGESPTTGTPAAA
ncbi:GTA-gp10 family protein [Sphingomonas sp. SRS2]|uniref:GTA-gp10 family protein n=1 Tax=Sphingomonas sp. SRS2 TaxID=133190 RepID=UPI000696B720|nr:GTA-gp10 family protein [Sphingomonas sp. SRS2]